MPTKKTPTKPRAARAKTTNKTKAIRKAPAKPINKVRDEAATALQKLVRIKAATAMGHCACVTCGLVQDWRSMHGGHFIPRGIQSLLLVEENIHPQCRGCNVFRMQHGIAPYQYFRYMRNAYGGDEVERMLRQAEENPPVKWERAWLEQFTSSTKQAIEDVAASKGLSV